jgi:hypothetical protein
MKHMNMNLAHSFESPGTTHPAIRVRTHNTILDYTHVKALKFSIIMSLDYRKYSTEMKNLSSVQFRY